MRDENLVREAVNVIKDIMRLKIVSLNLKDLENATEMMQDYKWIMRMLCI